MAICLIVENPDQTNEQAEQVMAHVRSTGPVPPEGARLMLAGPANPGWRVISVWDSKEALDRFFAERLSAAYEEAGLSFDSVKTDDLRRPRAGRGRSHRGAAAGVIHRGRPESQGRSRGRRCFAAPSPACAWEDSNLRPTA